MKAMGNGWELDFDTKVLKLFKPYREGVEVYSEIMELMEQPAYMAFEMPVKGLTKIKGYTMRSGWLLVEEPGLQEDPLEGLTPPEVTWPELP
jgi:hypothetical protein